MQEEIWKDIPGHEGKYQVSNLGRVKSLPRNVKNGLKLYKSKERFLILNSKCAGYKCVRLFNNVKFKTEYLHIILAITFLNHKKQKGIVVDHIDNDKLNNNLDNLQVITHRENSSKDQKNKSSKYVGVNLCPQTKKWMASIRINKKSIHLGRFIKEEDAREAYKLKLKQIENGNI